MNTEEVPIARIIENPKSVVKITIKNIPPPIPSKPEENPTKRPVKAMEIKLKSNYASFSFLSSDKIFLIAMNNNKSPKIISRTLEVKPDATKPPIKLPMIPKIPNLIPGSIILSNFWECLYAPLVAVGIIIAKLVPNEISIARSGATPIYFKRKYWKGTIKNPPPTPKSPDANPATIRKHLNFLSVNNLNN